jgi:hypothetical protein
MLRGGIHPALVAMSLEVEVRVTELVLLDMNLLVVRAIEVGRGGGVMNLGARERGRRWLRGGRGLLIDDVPFGERGLLGR